MRRLHALISENHQIKYLVTIHLDALKHFEAQSFTYTFIFHPSAVKSITRRPERLEGNVVTFFDYNKVNVP